MTDSEFEIVALANGESTLRHRSTRETFHPGIGPMAEAEQLHLAPQKWSTRFAANETAVVWDVGLGAAANAIAVIEHMKRLPRAVDLRSFDISLSALHAALQHLEGFAYLTPYQELLARLLEQGSVELPDGGRWTLYHEDFRVSLDRTDLPAPHAILYDPYSPKTNGELWTLDHFARLRQKLDPARPCLMSNYTRSSSVRTTWLLAGFYVGRGPGIGGKEETSLATQDLRLLDQPLDSIWIDKLSRSQNAAPRRAADQNHQQPIHENDLNQLLRHPQFSKE